MRSDDKTLSNLKKVLAVNAKINSTLDLDELLGILMTTASEVMETKAASLMLIDEATNELVFKVALGEKGAELTEKFRLKVGEGIGGYVAQTGESLIVNDPQNDPRLAKRFDKATGFSTDAMICVPMKSRNKIIGILQAINPIARDIFEEEDLELFEFFATQATLSVENAKLHTTLVKQEKSRQELEIAQQIQQNFLPDLTYQAGKAHIAAVNISALSVGGDFYDVFHIDEHRTGLVIGDVSGKGVPAALFMVKAISEFRFMMSQNKHHPSDLLEALNKKLSQDTTFGMFVTLMYVLLDYKEQKIFYSSAGHHPILFKTPRGDVRYLKDTGGMPLGLMEDAPRPDAEFFPMTTGSFLTLYTDGVNEARNIKGEEYGLEKLKACISSSSGDADHYAKTLMNSLREFTLGAPQHDDTTVVIIQI